MPSRDEKTPRVLTQLEMQGGNEMIQPMFLHGRCHIHAGVEAEYMNGVVTIRCLECKKHIVALRVAVAPESAKAQA